MVLCKLPQPPSSSYVLYFLYLSLIRTPPWMQSGCEICHAVRKPNQSWPSAIHGREAAHNAFCNVKNDLSSTERFSISDGRDRLT